MLLKKSTIAICSSGSLPSNLCLHTPAGSPNGLTAPKHHVLTTPSPSTYARPAERKHLQFYTRLQHSRSFATIRDEAQRDVNAVPAPEPTLPSWPTTTNPTPYEIFDQSRTAPYSKKKFYSLVKHYHPDRHAHATSTTLSRATKLERYRLLVAANTILSDPAKRRAYDLYGAGWGPGGANSSNDMSNSEWREADRAWRRQPGSAAGNATWEDWERWHEQNGTGGKRKQEPLYMSNGLFVVALAAFVVLGGWGQATRAGNHSVQLIEMRENSSQNISEDMWRRRQEKAILSREDRVEMFLRQREGWSPPPGNEKHMPKD